MLVALLPISHCQYIEMKALQNLYLIFDQLWLEWMERILFRLMHFFWLCIVYVFCDQISLSWKSPFNLRVLICYFPVIQYPVSARVGKVYIRASQFALVKIAMCFRFKRCREGALFRFWGSLLISSIFFKSRLICWVSIGYKNYPLLVGWFRIRTSILHRIAFYQ